MLQLFEQMLDCTDGADTHHYVSGEVSEKFIEKKHDRTRLVEWLKPTANW